MRSIAIPPAGVVLERMRHDAAENRGTALFGGVDVRILPHQKLIPAAAMRHQGGQIALRPGREKQRARVSEAFGRNRLQAVDGRIVPIHVVADLGGGHGGAHSRGGPSHRVAAQIDQVLHANRRLPAPRLASTTASAVMLTMRRTVAAGVRMCAGAAQPSRIGPIATLWPAADFSRL